MIIRFFCLYDIRLFCNAKIESAASLYSLNRLKHFLYYLLLFPVHNNYKYGDMRIFI